MILISKMINIDVEKSMQWLQTEGLDWGVQLLLAIVTLIIGFWIVRRITKGVEKTFVKRDFDKTLSKFFISLISSVLKVLVIISVATMVGIKMTSFIAILTAATFAVGMALQGTLGHFASGIMILIFRPYKIGDFIDAAGQVGTVKDLHLFYTVLNTFDNKTIIIPNGKISNDTITNFSVEPIRRLDITCGISYTDNIDTARKVMEQVYLAEPAVLKDPAPMVIVSNLGDSSVDMQMRLYLKGEDYWPAKFSLTENLKKAFDEAGVSIPFPQQDVHLFNH